MISQYLRGWRHRVCGSANAGSYSRPIDMHVSGSFYEALMQRQSIGFINRVIGFCPKFNQCFGSTIVTLVKSVNCPVKLDDVATQLIVIDLSDASRACPINVEVPLVSRHYRFQFDVLHLSHEVQVRLKFYRQRTKDIRGFGTGGAYFSTQRIVVLPPHYPHRNKNRANRSDCLHPGSPRARFDVGPRDNLVGEHADCCRKRHRRVFPKPSIHRISSSCVFGILA
jgi:hypothetical protein